MCSQCKMLIYEGEILEITSNSVLEDGGGGGGGGGVFMGLPVSYYTA